MVDYNKLNEFAKQMLELKKRIEDAVPKVQGYELSNYVVSTFPVVVAFIATFNGDYLSAKVIERSCHVVKGMKYIRLLEEAGLLDADRKLTVPIDSETASIFLKLINRIKTDRKSFMRNATPFTLLGFWYYAKPVDQLINVKNDKRLCSAFSLYDWAKMINFTPATISRAKSQLLKYGIVRLLRRRYQKPFVYELKGFDGASFEKAFLQSSRF